MVELDKNKKREIIARRVAKELHDGDYVNLGIGIPQTVVNYIEPGVTIISHGEEGVLGMGMTDTEHDHLYNCIDAGGVPVKLEKGAAYFDIAEAFNMARGGHLDCTVLGALQVDETGSLASWWIPGVRMPGMGGAMDILVNAKRVIIAMEHTQKGEPKILKKCTMPLTAVGCIESIITEMGMFRKTPDGLMLTEINPGFSVDDIRACTEAEFSVSDRLQKMYD